jgi:peptidyl-tRNA hydrolase
MANIRHTVVIRKDLNFSTGLLAAQVAHISDEFMRNSIIDGRNLDEKESEWIKDPYLSVLAVNTAEELKMIAERAGEAGLMVNTWFDTVPCPTLSGETMKVFVGCSIGPDDFDKIKLITGNLPLY